MKDIGKMTVEELEAAKTAIWHESQALRTKKTEIEAELQRRMGQERADEAVARATALLASVPAEYRDAVMAGAAAAAGVGGNGGAVSGEGN